MQAFHSLAKLFLKLTAADFFYMWEKARAFATNEDTDTNQPAHLCSLIFLCNVHYKGLASPEQYLFTDYLNWLFKD